GHRARDGVDLVDPQLPVLFQEVDPGDASHTGYDGYLLGQLPQTATDAFIDLGEQLPSARHLTAPGQILLVVAVDAASFRPGGSLDRRYLERRVGLHPHL